MAGKKELERARASGNSARSTQETSVGRLRDPTWMLMFPCRPRSETPRARRFPLPLAYQ